MLKMMFAAVLLSGVTLTSASAENASLLSLQSKAVMKGGKLPVIVEFHEPAPTFIPQGNRDRAETVAIRHEQRSIIAAAKAGKAVQFQPNKGLSNIKLMDHVPLFAGAATPEMLSRLASDPRVKRIFEDRMERPFLNQSVPLIGMSKAYTLGATGTGRAVAIIDTGVDKNHEFLKGKVISEACYSTNDADYGAISLCPGKKPSSTASGSGADCPPSFDGCGHGTHVAGIAAGFDSAYETGEPKNGVAKSASIVAIKVFSRVDGIFCGTSSDCIVAFTSDVVKGLERVYKLRAGVAGRKIDAVNMSLGGDSSTGYCSDPRGSIIAKLRKAGIATVIASGNDGFRNAVSYPACLDKAITVGASTKKASKKPQRIASYSNMGVQVDVLAPGGDRYPSKSTGLILSSYQGSYGRLAGTSMAAPHVAGAIAAIRSRPACRNKSITKIEAAMKKTGPRIKDQRYGGSYTKRRLNVPALMKQLGCA